MKMLPLLSVEASRSFEDCLAELFPGLARTASKIVEHNSLLDFDDTVSLAPSTLAILLEQDERLPGIRDELTPQHPVVIRLLEKLKFHLRELPPPDPQMAEHLAQFGDLEKRDKICLLDGVPIPVGEAQQSFFIGMRWRPLFHPHAAMERIYRGHAAYDRLVTTDLLQAPVLDVTTRKYFEQLVILQRHSPELFIAIWCRRFQKAEELLCSGSINENLVIEFFTVPMRVGKCDQLLVAAAIMSEWERLFEIADAMKLDNGLSREAVQAALDSADSWEDILARDDEISRFLTGCPFHVRANHRSMNRNQSAEADTCTLARVSEALENSLVFQDKYRRVEKIDGVRPVRFFAGVELAKFIPVMLEQMHENLMQHREDGGTVAIVHRTATQRRRKQMLLSIIATSEICDKTARHIARTLEAKQGDENKADSKNNRTQEAALQSDEWRRIYITAIFVGIDTLEEDAEQYLRNWVGPKTTSTIMKVAGRLGQAFKYKLGDIADIARECTPCMGEGGWTMGARFDAWLQPEAEVEFLRKCTRHTLYRQDLDIKAKKWEEPLAQPAGTIIRPIDRVLKPIGLPLIHPLQHTHESLPSVFKPLQFTDVIGSALMSRRWLMLAECLRQAGLRLAALSPITDDPWLSERISSRPKQGSLAKNKRRKGRFQSDQIAYVRDYRWQRS